MFSPLSPGPWVWGLGVWDLGFRVQGLGFRVWGLWFGVRGFGFRTLNRPKHQAPKEVKEVSANFERAAAQASPTGSGYDVGYN